MIVMLCYDIMHNADMQDSRSPAHLAHNLRPGLAHLVVHNTRRDPRNRYCMCIRYRSRRT